MRAILQRVSSASITIDETVTGQIGRGLVVLLGVEAADTAEDLDWLANKIVNLRLFADAEGAMNHSVRDIAGGILLVSQFTLFASTKKGTRPSWHRAAPPALAEPLYDQAVQRFSAALGSPVATGRFGAMMSVALVNDGPVTLIIDSKARE